MQQQLPEDELIAGLKRGDDAAFRQVYLLHFNMIRYLVIKNSGREEDADDVFQDALVVLFEKLNAPDFVLTASLKTFLYSICRNLWLKRLEKNKREAFVDFEQVDLADETESGEEAAENKTKLRNAIRQLGEQCQKVLVLFYFFKKNMEEIATELNYTNADNAKNQKYKCLQRLKAVYAGAKPVRR